ncbi:MAG: MBOAT family protein [Candidatus Omnitrophica bacterium]|nr:MBOAT family protein [Candidatus Omnitrophota bacterium]
MLFNSLQFALFFPITYFFYLISNHKWQNRFLLIASYIFYSAWDWRFLSLIIISTVIDYFCGLKIAQADDKRKKRKFLLLSLITNLSLLGFFKYFGFFADSLLNLLHSIGIDTPLYSLKIILPVGISFYTFQTLSYSIDIYRKEIKPTKNFLDFALFVSFFPQLVAGPIERAKNLLPQILSPRKITLDSFYQGIYLILWGLFQKVFVADNLAKIVNDIFAFPQNHSGGGILIALYAFSLQIFCDFCGYSNIARGIGKCLGFEIMVNFNCPYFSQSPQEFWKRWHISLSSWFKDYLYIPLGGNRKGKAKTYRNLILTMGLAGLWHGASWNFIFWGLYQAALLIIYKIVTPLNFKIDFLQNRPAKKIAAFINGLIFFHLTCLGWLLFRCESLTQIVIMSKKLFGDFSFSSGISIIPLVFFSWFLILIEIFQYKKNDLLFVLKLPVFLRTLIYIVIFYSIILYGSETAEKFIYFQF